MSRIHDALKKAEQERAAAPLGPGPAGEAPPLEEMSRVARPVVSHPVAAAPPLETHPGVFSYPALLERCPQHPWHPDPEKVLTFGAQGHLPGNEEFRTLRSRLYQLRDKQPLRSVLITSALPAEGKTFIAANLAQVVVRQHERRALLIDADLRWSRLHTVLGAPSTPGLTEYLRGEADEFTVLQRGHQENLFFIPGGKPVSNPAELIGGGRLKVLLERMAPLFDWIILDSPPAVPVSDASLLGDLCDGILVVVRAAATPFDMAQRTLQEFTGRNLLGVVLNATAPGTGYSSYYYRHYGQHSNNGKGKG